MPAHQSDRRGRLESRWRSRQGPEFPYYIPGPPPQLVELLKQGESLDGPALDLGCGSGVTVSYLARYFRPAVGVDLAFAAIQQARKLATAEHSHASFVVADVPELPFGAGVFAFIFDRGCFQSMPKEVWPGYFAEVERLLKPGGVFQLMTSKPSMSLSRALRLFRARIRSLLRGRGMGGRQREFISDASIAQLLPPSMTTILLEHFPFRLATGVIRDFTHAVFRRR